MDDPNSGIDPVWQVMTTKQLAYDIWESDVMRTYFMKMSMSSAPAAHPQDVMGVHNLIWFLAINLSWEPGAILTGGMHNVTHSLQRAFSEMGGKFFVLHEVDKLLIENGVTKGVRLADGTEIEARKVVVADVDAQQLIFRLIGKEYVSDKIAQRVENINCDRANLWWGSIAVHELPEYKAVNFNPDCNALIGTCWGPRDPEYMEQHVKEMWDRGIPEKLHLLTVFDSIWDKTRAPAGKHISLVEQHAPPARRFSEREWLKLKKEVANEVVRQWQWYAPNMTWDNVIGLHVQSPDDVQKRNINMREGCWGVQAHMASQMGRFRPVPGLSEYRMPIKNLYLCSAAAHPSGGTGRACSYNCFKVIAEDLGLPKIWEQKGRPF
jgi:phytoene dehydrogenase-like protein